MSRPHLVLVCALLALLGLVGVARLVDRGDSAVAEAPVESSPTTPTPPATTAPVASTAPATPVAADCSMSTRIAPGDTAPDVACLETHLIAQGLLAPGTADEVYDATTETAVRLFQTGHSLVVDGVIGPQTARQLGAWAGPDVLPPDPATCQASGHSAAVDRFNQRAWLCADGAITKVMPMTSAWSQPDPGSYEVYAKDLNASSTLTGEYSTMTHFVAFAHGKYTGARIAFHSIPKYSNGEYIQPLDSVGTEELHGESSGCIRVLPDDAVEIWDWLDIGDAVTVVS
jgi:peptidoglycan hydrolase-like protein with peptidoglycan-binding domain